MLMCTSATCNFIKQASPVLDGNYVHYFLTSSALALSNMLWCILYAFKHSVQFTAVDCLIFLISRTNAVPLILLQILQYFENRLITLVDPKKSILKKYDQSFITIYFSG